MNGTNSSILDTLSVRDRAEIVNEKQVSDIIVIYLFSYTFLLIVVSFLTYSLREPEGVTGSIFTDPLIRHLIFVGSAGGLGGIVYCMRGFYEHKAEGDFDTNYLSWYLFRPVISTITGIFVFFLLAANLLDTSGLIQEVNIGDVMFLCSVAFLAGFGFTQFYGKIDDLANILFQPSDKRKSVNITWKPDDITYGMELNEKQLNARASEDGNFFYKPAKGTLLSAGTTQLHVDFMPYENEKYKTVSKNATIDVLKATPMIDCNNHVTIPPGKISSQTLSFAKAMNPITKEEIKEGNFTFTLEDGTILMEGRELKAGNYKLEAVFTPNDTVNYNSSEPMEVNIFVES